MTAIALHLLAAAVAAAPSARTACPQPAPPVADAPAADAWELRPGVWFPSSAPVHGVTAEPGAAGGCDLVFRGNAAASWRRPLAPGPRGGLEVRASLDAAVGDREGLSWVSLMLTADRTSQGWVTAPEHLVGLLVRSNGAIQLFSGGREVASTWTDGPPAPADAYAVTLRVVLTEGPDDQRLELSGSVGGKSLTAELAAGPDVVLPARTNLLVGAHFHPEDPMVSRIAASATGW